MNSERIRTAKLGWKNFSADRLGTWLLVSLLVVAPLSEALKNVLIVALFIWWLSTQGFFRDVGGAPLHLITLVLFSAVPLVSVVTSDLARPTDLLLDVGGAVKLILVLLPVYSLSSKHRNSTTLVAIALTLGALLGCIEAVVAWKQSSNSYPVLKALVSANWSALYMTVVLIAAISLAWSPKRTISALGWVGILVSLWYFVTTRSVTAAVVAVCVLLLAVITSVFTERRKVFITGLVCLGLLSAATLATSQLRTHWSQFTSEFERNMYGSNIGSKRVEIFNTAWEVVDRNLWFGAGYRQFGKATSVERVAAELEREGRNYRHERDRFFHVNHGHNVWTQVLVERGLVGVALLISFFVSTGVSIFRNGLELYRRETRSLEPFQMIFISAAVWTVLFVGGIGNSTVHNEHGMAALALMVFSLARFHEWSRIGEE